MVLVACTRPAGTDPGTGAGGHGGQAGDTPAASGGQETAGGSGGGAPAAAGGTGGTIVMTGQGGSIQPADGGGQAGNAPSSGLRPMSDGCGKDATGTGGYVKQTMSIAGRSRDWFVRVPAKYDRARAYALVFDMHGTGGVAPGNGMGIEIPAGEDAIIVRPQGIGGVWALGAEGEDVQFYDAMYRQILDRYCIDERKVFVTGFSRGGAMANLLGCIRGDRIRAVGPLAGWHPARMGTCVGQPAAWFAHATGDGVVAITQGYRARGYFLASSGCGESTMPVTPSPCVAYQGCKAGAEVVFCEIPGEHGTPIEWSVPALWGFFAALPLR